MAVDNNGKDPRQGDVVVKNDSKDPHHGGMAVKDNCEGPHQCDMAVDKDLKIPHLGAVVAANNDCKDPSRKGDTVAVDRDPCQRAIAVDKNPSQEIIESVPAYKLNDTYISSEQ